MGEVLDELLRGVPYPAQPVPTIGRTVHYRVSRRDAEAINEARAMTAVMRQAGASWSCHQVHEGNKVREGDAYPMIITAVWGPDAAGDLAVNGQVFLDGNDVHWATTVCCGTGPGTWSWPPRG